MVRDVGRMPKKAWRGFTLAPHHREANNHLNLEKSSSKWDPVRFFTFCLDFDVASLRGIQLCMHRLA